MKSKNLIYIVIIDDPSKHIQCSHYAKYSVKTWEYYCEKWNIDLMMLDENLVEDCPPIWNKELIYQFGKGYDKIGIVDSDTMVKWNAPNVFDLVTDGVYGVNDLCDMNWLFQSIGQRQRFYPNIELDLMKYLNAGVLFFTNDVVPTFKNLLDFYKENRSEIDQIKGGGKEQTLLNFQFVKDNVKVNLLSPEWNLLSIHRKNMFIGNWQLNNDLTPYFIKYSNVWHFTGFPIEDRIKIMSEVWEMIKQNYE